MGKPLIDRTGHRYGRLTVVKRADNYRGNARWVCKCDCGEHRTVMGNDLQRGKQKSCGCQNAEELLKHGMSYTSTYRIWQHMRLRCINPKESGYKNYGGRGISVCEEWEDFRVFLADMGARPERHSLGRIDNGGNYCKSNCQWATMKQQLNNKRTNRVIEFKGRRQTMMQWAEELGMTWTTLRNRLDNCGWSIERALTEPVRRS